MQGWLLLGALKDFLQTVELDWAYLGSNGDKTVVPIDVDTPNSALLACLNDIDWLTAVQIEHNESAFVVSGY